MNDALLEPNAAARPPSTHHQSPSQVDIAKLADKVYRLMQAEVRLAQVRGQPRPEQGKK